MKEVRGITYTQAGKKTGYRKRHNCSLWLC